jgi:hypothetical protein
MLTKRFFCSLMATSFWAASIPGFVWAHPGHGNANPDSPAHYLLSFEHTAPMVAIALFAIAMAIVLGRRSRRVRVRV